MRLAVVSGTWRENVEAVLTASNLRDAFELIVGKDDVQAVKPDPEAYLLALERLKLKPADAIAVEDSPSGLHAARAAGIPVIAVGHRRERGDWVGDCPFVASFQPLAEIWKHLGPSAKRGEGRVK